MGQVVISDQEVRHALREAQAVAEHTSRCLRKKVGAVLFDREGKFLAYGANLTEPGLDCDKGHCPRGRLRYDEMPADSAYDNCIAVHAEKVAVALATERLAGGPPEDAVHAIAQRGVMVQLEGSTMVVTHEPCHECKPWLIGMSINIYWPGGRVIHG